MRSLLPSAIAINLLGIAACHHEVAPVTPGPAIPAEPVIAIGTMKAECDAAISALETWKGCPNLDDGGRSAIDSWIEVAKLDFDAAAKVDLDDKQQHAIALSCHRFVDSAHAATARCDAGKPPPRQY